MEGKDESIISLFIKAAMRVVIKVKDFYVGVLTDCSGQLDYGVALSCPAGAVPATLPQSFSVNSTNWSSRREKYNGIPRSASTKSYAGNGGRREQVRKSPVVVVVPRSYSVGMGKIEEEKTCEFGEEEAAMADAYPRSRSYAVQQRRHFASRFQ